MSESENITVGIRIRPLNERELSQGGQIEWFSESSTCLLEKPLDGSHESRSVFDRIYSSETDTVEVYHCQGQPVIEKFMKGFNGCIFCYGQTGSGKTHTMYGDRKKNLGLVPISVDQIFAHIEESKNIDYLLRCSYVEIYNESVNDLLDPSKLNLTIVEDKRVSLSRMASKSKMLLKISARLSIKSRL
jgi:hypothetical protein